MSIICPSCRGTEFEEIDDVLYCATSGCGIRVGGAKTVASTEFLGTEIRLTQEVTAPSSSSLKTKRVDKGSPWTSYEAFNLILAHQVRFLIDEMKAPQRLELVVLSLWAAFLSKSEVAFVDQNETDSRLPVTSRQRDIALIAKKMDGIPAIKKAKPSGPGKKKPFRLGHEKVAVPVIDPFDSSIECDLVSDIDFDWENTDTSNNLSSSNHSTESGEKSVVAPDESEANLSSRIDCLVETAGKEDDAEQQQEDEGSNKKRKRKYTFKRRQKAAVRVPPLLLEEDEMNSFGQEICDEYRKKKRPRNRSSKEFLDYMDLRTCLSLIYIACRFIGWDVHVIDLVHWVNRGSLLYFASNRIFPDDWCLLDRDHRSFCPDSSPCPVGILNRASKLVSYLEVTSLRTVDINALFSRLLNQLNLPSSLLDFMLCQDRIVSLINRISRYEWSSRTVFRFYELHAIALIIITIRKLYGSDEDTIRKVCDQIRSSSRRKNNCFCLDEWIEVTRIRVAIIRHHFVPLLGECESSIADAHIVTEFHHQVVSNWRISGHNVSRQELAVDEDLIRIFRKLMSQKDPETIFPGPSFTLLTDADEFVMSRIPAESSLHKTLRSDFRDKSLSHVQMGTRFANMSYDVIIPRMTKKWSDVLPQLPDPIALFLQLSSWILSWSCVQMIPEIKKVEKMLFPEHYMETEPPAQKTRKKKKH